MAATEAVAAALEKCAGVAEMLLKPRATRALAKAEAEATLTTTQAEIAAAELKVQARRRCELDEVRHYVNLSETLAEARAEIEHKGARKLLPEKSSEGESDPDWFHKWAGYAKESSDADIRALWAKVLAGEIVQPGKFSLRLLHTISLLRKAEAEQFQLFANYLCRDLKTKDLFQIIASELNPLLERRGFSRETIRRLELAGLVIPTSGIVHSNPMDLQSCAVDYGGRTFILRHDPPKGSRIETGAVSLRKRELTFVGLELYELCNIRPDSTYCEALFFNLLRRDGSQWIVMESAKPPVAR